jgi:hypothetical protein
MWPGFTLRVDEAVKGHTDSLMECGGRGTCNTQTALCKCMPSWYSGNGTGGPGRRGDCSYFDITGPLVTPSCF